VVNSPGRNDRFIGRNLQFFSTRRVKLITTGGEGHAAPTAANAT
jgi:hypothetical protein